MKVFLDPGAILPVRAHSKDAGLDLHTPIDFKVSPLHPAIIHTGVHVQLPYDTAGLLVAKSGLNVKNDLTSTGLIDEGYTGEIVVKLYKHFSFRRPWAYRFRKGDKISQLVVFQVLHPNVEPCSKFDENTERGDHGFGSTGR